MVWYTQPIRLRLNVNSARDARKDLKVIPDSTRLPAREEGAEPVRGAQQSPPGEGRKRDRNVLIRHSPTRLSIIRSLVKCLLTLLVRAVTESFSLRIGKSL
jgi:hypothetical protein